MYSIIIVIFFMIFIIIFIDISIVFGKIVEEYFVFNLEILLFIVDFVCFILDGKICVVIL